MSKCRFKLRKRARISYYEPEEPDLDEYLFCSACGDYVYEYCSIHGPLLVVPDTRIPRSALLPSHITRAMLTLPHVFLRIAASSIPGAGLGVFAARALPSDIRFGPYAGTITQEVASNYCWQIYGRDRSPRHLVDGGDASASNWLRYVNCSRDWREQNLVAFQYRGQIYYRTIRIIPRGAELLVYYGSEFAKQLGAYKRGPAKVVQKAESNSCTEQQSKTETPKNTGPEKLTQNADNNSKTEQQSEIETPKNTEKVEEARTTIEKFNKVHETTSVQKVPITDTPSTSKATNKVKSTHIDEKRFKCDVCGRRFNHSGHLKNHLRTHTGEKPYKCDFCEDKCSQSGNLKTHLLTHAGEKPYKCDFCGYKSTNSGYLKRHLRTHTGEKPYKCDFCEYKCSLSENLKRHLRTHTGEKPYKCDVCEYRCSNSSHLKRHIKTHGKKP